MERSECSLALRKALRRVPDQYRDGSVDHFISGLSIKDIAAQR
jgi:DNA-directed RNA polymerase specialized sigma24 family protein